MRKRKGYKGLDTKTYKFEIVIVSDNSVCEGRILDYLSSVDHFKEMTILESIEITATNKEAKKATDDLPF